MNAYESPEIVLLAAPDDIITVSDGTQSPYEEVDPPQWEW